MRARTNVVMVADRGETGKIFTANICSSWQLIFGLTKPQSLFLEFSYMIFNSESGLDAEGEAMSGWRFLA